MWCVWRGVDGRRFNSFLLTTGGFFFRNRRPIGFRFKGHAGARFAHEQQLERSFLLSAQARAPSQQPSPVVRAQLPATRPVLPSAPLLFRKRVRASNSCAPVPPVTSLTRIVSLRLDRARASQGAAHARGEGTTEAEEEHTYVTLSPAPTRPNARGHKTKAPWPPSAATA